MHRWKASLLVLLGACSYGVLSTFVKFAYRDGFGVSGVTGSQMVFGLLMFVLLLALTRTWRTLDRKQWLALMAAGSLIGGVAVFYYASLQFVEASLAIVLLFQFTWIGVLLEWIVDDVRPRMPVLLSLLFLAVGTVLGSNIWFEGMARFSWVGIILGLLGACSYAGFIMASGKVSTEVNPWMRSMVMLVGATVFTYLIFPPEFLGDGSLWRGLWMWGTVLAFFGLVIPTLFLTFGVPHIGSGLSTILGAAELPTAVFMSWLVLGEIVTLWQWVGVLLILTGIGVGQYRGEERSDMKR